MFLYILNTASINHMRTWERIGVFQGSWLVWEDRCVSRFLIGLRGSVFFKVPDWSERIGVFQGSWLVWEDRCLSRFLIGLRGSVCFKVPDWSERIGVFQGSWLVWFLLQHAAAKMVVTMVTCINVMCFMSVCFMSVCFVCLSSSSYYSLS